ncbi:hypothetical protein HBB16_10390 [Pseudonocardia sp. MCCB 268]|nr:hypothetical protein [Pseudonocardia cytotoxica]
MATGTGAVMVPARPWVLARMTTPRRHLTRGTCGGSPWRSTAVPAPH